ncbi:MAG: hypothetical protein AB8B55_19505 [Mariniblastus sp.]
MVRIRKSKLGYDAFEPRRLLAHFGPTLETSRLRLQAFAPDQVLSVSQDDNATVFTLPNGDVWSGNDIEGRWVGSGTSTLTYTASPRLAIEIDDSTNPVDLFFATDFKDLTLYGDVEDISQSDGTSVQLTAGSLGGETITLTQPENIFDRVTLSSTGEANIYSSQKIDLPSASFHNGMIRSDESIVIGQKSGNTVRSTFVASGNLTLEAPTLLIAADQIGVTGQINLFGREGIIFNSVNVYAEFDLSPFNGNSELTRLQFQSEGHVFISILEDLGEFNGTSVSVINLVGENTAKTLEFRGGDNKIFDAEGTSLVVEQNANFWGTQTVFLADHESDLISVGGHAHFDARPKLFLATGVEILEEPGNLVINEAGDVRFGSFGSNSSTYVTVFEDDASFISNIGRLGLHPTEVILYSSKGDFELYRGGFIISKYHVDLTADGRISTYADEAKTFKASTVNLTATQIFMDEVQTGLMTFNSSGNVILRSTSNIAIRGNNTAKGIYLTSTGRISNVANASIEADVLNAKSDRSVWLANAGESDNLMINGLASFQAPDFVSVGQIGSANFGELSFNTGVARIKETSRMHLVGNNVADAALLSSSSYITDAANMRLSVSGYAEFNTPAGVYLGDDSRNKLSLCGFTAFNVGEFAHLHHNGELEISNWSVTNGAVEIVSFDSRC